MKKNEHINDPEKDIFNHLKIDYPESKEDIWSKMEAGLSVDKKENTKVFRINWKKWSVAAIGIILLGSGLFMRFYSIQINTNAGEFLSHELPDGSKVRLNAESTIEYAPYWWNFNREVVLDGEAFFEVEKGEKFAVISEMGTTEVLGTSFNIYARDRDYRVLCLTGKVKVTNASIESIVLMPGEAVTMDNEKNPEKQLVENTDEILSWKLNKFIYNTTPLEHVFSDFERQYDIKIDCQNPTTKKLTYTGLFQRDIAPDQALEIVCRTFDLKFEKADSNLYLVK